MEPSKQAKSAKSSTQVAVSKQMTATAYYTGPIPPASEMAKYDEIQPGFADRIMALAESQSAHRQRLETQVINNSCFVQKLGVFFAFLIAVLSLGVAALCMYLDKAWFGAVLGGFGLSSIVGAFIYGTHSNRQERNEKMETAQKNIQNKS